MSMLNELSVSNKLPGVRKYFAGSIRYCVFSFLVLMCLVVGCSTRKMSVNSLFNDLPGTYKVEYKPYSIVIATQTLELKTDCTYEQVFTPAKGTGWKNTGRWELLEFENGSKCLSLLDARLGLTDSQDRIRTDAEYLEITLPISRRGYPIILTINDDLGYYFKKMKKPLP